MKFRYFSLAVVVLIGCTSLTPQQCMTANWQKIGEQDGLSGYADRIDRHAKACAKVHIQPNTAHYQQGYDAGLKRYCQPQVILDAAIQGRGRYDICPAHLQSGLSPYYESGRRFYETHQQREQLIKELEKYQDDLLDTKLTVEKRNEYIKKIKDLKAKKYNVDRKFDEAQRALERIKQRQDYDMHLH